MTVKQLSVFIENKTGRINDVTRILGENGINMTAFSLAETAEFGIMRIIASDVELAAKVLKEARFGVSVNNVICLSLPDKPGALSKVLELLARENIFIEYMYAFSQDGHANVVIRPTDVARGVEILSAHNFELVNSDALK